MEQFLIYLFVTIGVSSVIFGLIYLIMWVLDFFDKNLSDIKAVELDIKYLKLDRDHSFKTFRYVAKELDHINKFLSKDKRFKPFIDKEENNG